MEITFEKEQKSPVEYNLKVTVPAEEMSGRMDSALKELSAKATIPGFRPGKAPKKVLLDKFGPAITQETVQDVLQDAYKKALKDSGLEPVTAGEMSEIHFEPGNPLTFSVSVEVLPDIQIPDLSQTEVSAVKPTAEEEDIALALDNLRESAATYAPTDEAVSGDSVIKIDLQEVDETGVPLIGRVQKDVQIDMRRQQFGEEFATKILGLKTGDTAPVAFQGTPDETGKAKSLRLLVTVKEIQKKELPTLNDEFAAKVNPNLQSLDELKNDLRKYLEARAGFQARQQLYRDVADDLLRKTEFPVPPRMLDEYLDRMAEEGAASSKKAKPDTAAVEQFKTEFRTSAIWNLRWYMLRGKIIEEFGIKIEPGDFDGEITRLAAIEEMSPDELKKKLSHDQKHHIRDDLMERKLFEFLENKIKVTSKSVTLAEFEGRNAASKLVTA